MSGTSPPRRASTVKSRAASYQEASEIKASATVESIRYSTRKRQSRAGRLKQPVGRSSTTAEQRHRLASGQAAAEQATEHQPEAKQCRDTCGEESYYFRAAESIAAIPEVSRMAWLERADLAEKGSWAARNKFSTRHCGVSTLQL